MEAFRFLLTSALLALAQSACDTSYAFPEALLLKSEGVSINLLGNETQFDASYGDCAQSTDKMAEYFGDVTGIAQGQNPIKAIKDHPYTFISNTYDVNFFPIIANGNYRVVMAGSSSTASFENDQVYSAWWNLTAISDTGSLKADHTAIFGIWRFNLGSGERCLHFRSADPAFSSSNLEPFDLHVCDEDDEPGNNKYTCTTGAGRGMIKVQAIDPVTFDVTLDAREMITFPAENPNCPSS